MPENYSVFTNATGHLQPQEMRPNFILTNDESETIESGDRVTLVDRHGKESPVLVRILRAVTPRTFSARLARSKWKSPSPENIATTPRIFEIVREPEDFHNSSMVMIYFPLLAFLKHFWLFLLLDGNNAVKIQNQGGSTNFSFIGIFTHFLVIFLLFSLTFLLSNGQKVRKSWKLHQRIKNAVEPLCSRLFKDGS